MATRTIADILESIVKDNQKARGDFHTKSSRLIAIMTADTMEQLDDFTAGLEEEFREVPGGTGEDSAASGIDGSGGTEIDGSGTTEEPSG